MPQQRTWSGGSGTSTNETGGRPGEESQWIDIDLSDLSLPAHMDSPDQIALAASHVYERFAPYADEGWEWVEHPADRVFHGWVVEQRDGHDMITGAHMLSRRQPLEGIVSDARPRHGLSPYRTRQLTDRPWTAEAGSKRWKPLTRHN